MRKILPFFLLFFFFAHSANAVSISIPEHPSTISSEEFNLKVEIGGAKKDTTNYLRIDLYRDGTNDYFGYTHNNAEFYNGSDYLKYFPIAINAGGSASAQLKGKVDTGTSKYQGPGDYKIRVRRYTGSGGYSASDSNAGAVTTRLNLASTFVSTPEKKEANVESSYSEDSFDFPESLTTNSTIQTKSTSIKVTPQISRTPAKLPQEILGSSSTGVLRVTTTKKPSPTLAAMVKSERMKKLSPFFLAGIAFIAVSGILLYSKFKKSTKSDQYV